MSSKLDNIIETTVYDSATDDLSTDWDGIKRVSKQALKDLMLEIIGEDERMTFNDPNYRRLEKTGRNELRSDLRQRVNEL